MSFEYGLKSGPERELISHFPFPWPRIALLDSVAATPTFLCTHPDVVSPTLGRTLRAVCRTRTINSCISPPARGVDSGRDLDAGYGLSRDMVYVAMSIGVGTSYAHCAECAIPLSCSVRCRALAPTVSANIFSLFAFPPFSSPSFPKAGSTTLIGAYVCGACSG